MRMVVGALWVVALPGGCDGEEAVAADVFGAELEVADETEPEAPHRDEAREARGEESTPSRTGGGDGWPKPVCESEAACFSWCGAKFRDGSCDEAGARDLDAGDFGAVLCEPLVVEIDGDRARLADGVTDDVARCFLQVLRYGHRGVAELYWSDVDSHRWGHLVVAGIEGQYARLEMRIEGTEPACGDALALSAAAAHVRAEREPLFDACLDTNEDVDLESCVLGPAATAFFQGHDWAFDVAFPWLSGTCGV
jgi:hypothetical protein